MRAHFITFAVATCLILARRSCADIEFLILHNNDLHGRIEGAVDKYGNHYGGYGRIAHVVKEARRAARNKQGPPVLYLYAGDTYLQPVWRSRFGANVAIEFLNLLRPDVACIGEHDLDRPIDDLYHFVEKIKFPMIVANLHFENDAYLRYKLRPSLIVRLDADADVAVGVIGYVASANSFLLPANSSFRYEDEVVAVRRECAELRRQGADVIVALGYAGFAVDRRIAAEVEDVDVVVGGLTNSLLWNGPAPDDAEANGQRVNGPYPTIVVQEASGKRVPIVQTYGFAKYVGRLRLSYDDGDDDSSRDAGTRTTVTVVEGDPIFLSADVPTDNEMSNALAGYQPTLRDMKQEQAVLGQSIIPLTADDAYNSESNLANFATDSILEFGIFQGYATSSSFVLLHAGAFRGQLATSKERPNITRMALEEAIPCYHKLIYVQIKGSYIKQALEDGISRLDGNSFLHGAGLRFDVDTGATKNDRVKSARTLCMAGEEPRYCPLDQTKDYRFLSVAYFLTQGGHDVLRYQGSLTTLTYDLMDAFVYIFNTFGIVVLDLDNRIFQYRRGESLKKGDLSSATIPTSFVLRFIHVLYLFCIYIFFIR